MIQPTLDMDAARLIARCLMASLFLQSAVTKSLNWGLALDEIRSFGLPRSRMLLLPALLVQFCGGLGVALGLLTFWSACALLAFMLPTTILAHGFWRYQGAERAHHFTGFFQNLTMSGGLVLLLATGAGRWSLDASIPMLMP